MNSENLETFVGLFVCLYGIVVNIQKSLEFIPSSFISVIEFYSENRSKSFT